ncbi:DUF6089 family protein [Echinicola jeungdonensis]|uniref:DUF6089 family protein n=1 Tax=Echinicola jeungdonensis TaxID=709343 RepID=UPI0025B55884|nr:DUF6089 family protein [Echinicola jeungdonensis]MDN3671289.1 DUF6089 family protein [Echinicola jeungdonensis]
MNAADSVRPLDAMAEARNAFFKGTLIEGHALMEFHFLDYLAPHSKFRYTPYGFIGFGYALFFGNGRSFEGNPDNPQGGVEESYSLGTPVIPFGIGIKYHLRERLFLALEMGFRPTVTDFLDKIEYNENYISRFLTLITFLILMTPMMFHLRMGLTMAINQTKIGTIF